ncbi:3-ketoacyl-CoA thiolase, mitochondrial [Chamberlinius hualienensis]
MTSLAKGVFLLGCKRTPFGALGGKLRDLTPPQLQLIAIKSALQNSGNIKAEHVDSVIVGCVMQWVSKDGRAVARQAGYRAGVPIESTALVVNRACGSGFQSVVNGAQEICMGESQVVLSGGCDVMSMAPFSARGIRYGTKLGQQHILEDTLWSGLTDWNINVSMGMTAENLAVKYNISREQCDQYALQSQLRWKTANENGVFADEIAPVVLEVKKGEEIMTVDEHPKPLTTLEKLAKLPTVFKKDGVVTAGTASGISDGAGAIIVASEEAVNKHNLKPLARLVAYSIVGCDPHIMGIGPAPAIRKLLDAAQLKLDDIDLVEINEAFAAQYLAVEKELGLDPSKTNVNGGAIALGHPLGATGSRITSHLAHQLRRKGLRYGIGSACIGGGQGIALLIESIH